ncbi:MAG: hypothetical protein IJX99_01275 [Clostridia bacterium]|nr:hypothetical protein [Clostridia bacterium]
MKIKLDTKEEIEEQKAHIKKTYSMKANTYLKFSLAVLFFDLLTYVFFLTLGEFDFGIIFELVALVFTIFAIFASDKEDIKKTKRNIIISSLSIGWLLLYDIICALPYLIDYLLVLTGYYYPSLYDLLGLTLVFIIAFNVLAYKAITRASGTVASEEDIKDWFYDVK